MSAFITHELIDRENPKCLYCNSDVDIKLDSHNLVSTLQTTFNVEVLTCRQCKEVFEIRCFERIDSTEYNSFIITCKNFTVWHNYIESIFYLSADRSILWPNMFGIHSLVATIPFYINFSDKEELFKKLKTYLIFS